MKASQFKELIKEAVREVLREELTSTTPPPPVQEQVKYKPTGNAMLDILNETRANMSTSEYRNIAGGTLGSSLAQSYNRSAFMPNQNLTPASNDPNVVARSVASAPKIGIDISQLGFVNKAAAIVSTATKKDKERLGG